MASALSTRPTLTASFSVACSKIATMCRWEGRRVGAWERRRGEGVG
jgi:hypothetical protein